MLLRSSTDLTDIIVRILSTRSRVSAKEIFITVINEYRKVSLQGIYNELRNLESKGVIIKNSGEYSLALSWTFEFVALADKIYDHYIAGSGSDEILPDSGKKLSWQFTDILRLDDFWVQVMLAAMQKETEFKNIFYAFPHPFYYLLPRGEEKASIGYSIYEESGWKLYAVFQADTFIFRRYARSINPNLLTFNVGQNLLATPPTIYTVLIYPYIITVEITQKLANIIDRLFFNVKSAKDLDYQEIHNILGARTKATFTIRHDKKRAEQLKKKFCRFFGI